MESLLNCIQYLGKRPSFSSEPTLLLVSWQRRKTWEICDSNDGCIYSPQAFEAEFGWLPPCPPSANRKTRRDWIAHRRKQGYKGVKSHIVNTRKKPEF